MIEQAGKHDPRSSAISWRAWSNRDELGGRPSRDHLHRRPVDYCTYTAGGWGCCGVFNYDGVLLQDLAEKYGPLLPNHPY